MNAQPSIVLLLAIGVVSGIASGVFGIGGGILIVPALVYLAGFSQHAATGTSLAVLLPPVGLAAVLEYYRHGNVDLKTAVIVALGLLVGAGVGAVVANHVSGAYLKLAFGLLLTAVGFHLSFTALRQLSWI